MVKNDVTLNYLIDLQVASYMYSFSYNLLPSAFSTYCAKPTHRYATRYAKSNYVVPKHISQKSESSIKVTGPKLWAEIPETLKELPFRKTFSKHLKNMYLDKLPTNKRSKKLNLKKKNSSNDPTDFDLQDLFDETGNEESFYGFEAQ